MWSWTCPNRPAGLRPHLAAEARAREAWTIADVRLTGLFMLLGAARIPTSCIDIVTYIYIYAHLYVLNSYNDATIYNICVYVYVTEVVELTVMRSSMALFMITLHNKGVLTGGKNTLITVLFTIFVPALFLTGTHATLQAFLDLRWFA